MRRMTIVIMVLMVAVLFVSGCAQNEEVDKEPSVVVKPPTDAGEAATGPGAPASAGDTLGQEVTEDINAIDNMDSELEDADVENLDEEFENIDW